MGIGQRIELRQGQTLVMTPQLQQAIKLLQLSNLELSAAVTHELESNPFLEQASVDGEAVFEADEPPTAAVDNSQFENAPTLEPGAPAANGGDEAPWPENGAAPGEAAEPDEADRKREADSGSYAQSTGGGFDQGDYNLENVVSAEVSLREHLLAQLHTEIDDRVEQAVGAQLIEALDESGYLAEPLAEFAERLGCPEALAEKVLGRIQDFDPPGVGARSLSECLALQLKERDRLDPAMQLLLSRLDLLARHDLAQLMKVCRVDAEDMADMVREIKALDPKPGLTFRHETSQPVVPDVFVRRAPDGAWLVELNSETLPRVLVNNRYFSRISDAAKNKTEQTYLAGCLTAANWLVRALEQRANTILKVSTEIVRHQEAFLVHGVRHLKPLNLRTIADAIGMHESTVSRVTSNKFMSTPRGILELKFFFTASLSSSDGNEAHSAKAVRDRIMELIDREKTDQVLSDDRIAEILMADGVDVARRTVAKYREALGISSSIRRRRQKASSF
jgi:RNA polymerase sigma-54 factor